MAELENELNNLQLPVQNVAELVGFSGLKEKASHICPLYKFLLAYHFG